MVEDQEWEWVEGFSGDSEAANWLFGESHLYLEGLHSTTTAVPEHHAAAASRALAQLMPTLIDSLQRDSAARETIEDLSGIPLDSLNPRETEAWPAIIGALASALPTIISAIPSIVSAVRPQTPRRSARGQPRQQTTTPRPTTPCICPPSSRQREPESAFNDAFTHVRSFDQNPDLDVDTLWEELEDASDRVEEFEAEPNPELHRGDDPVTEGENKKIEPQSHGDTDA